MSIRYVGVLQQVKRAMMAVSYLVALCGRYFCVKTSGDALIFGEIVRQVLTWLEHITEANPKHLKYKHLVRMENTFYILEELTSLVPAHQKLAAIYAQNASLNASVAGAQTGQEMKLLAVPQYQSMMVANKNSLLNSSAGLDMSVQGPQEEGKVS